MGMHVISKHSKIEANNNHKLFTFALLHPRRSINITKARIGGIDIPQNKFIEYSLQYIYGIGHVTAKHILANAGVENKRTFELNEEELQKLRDEIDKFCYEGDLRRVNALNIKRLKEISSYRGRRHISGLPLNGQRSKTNARTRKGKAKTVAGKKIARK